MIRNLLLASLCVCSLNALAQRGTCGTGVNWVLEDSTLTISGTGTMNDFTTDAMPSWNLYKSRIRDVIVQGDVSNVGNYAFYQYEKVKVVNLGEGVKKIGNNTFKDCTRLSNLTLPNSLEEIGEAWTNYSNRANTFNGCSMLKELVIPVNVRFIGANAFRNCGIEKIQWDAKNCTVDVVPYSNYEVFGGCPIHEANFGSEVKSIPQAIFISNKNLERITTCGSVEFVGENAFNGTTWLKNQELGKMLYIDHAAYIYLDDNEKSDPVIVVLPEGTTSITAEAFINNKKLVKITIPSTIQKIGNNSFKGCSSLGEIVYNAVAAENGIETKWSDPLFPNSVWSLTFGDKVKSIPDYLLFKMNGLSEINLPKSLESIGEHAFEGCNTVQELLIPDNVISIGMQAIYGLENLKKLTIGEGLKEIDYYNLFGKCPNLKTLIWNAIALNEKTFDPYHGTDACNAPIENVIYGDNVKYIPGQMFWKSATLSDVQFGKSVEKIGEAAFRQCENLKTANLPDNLEEICDYAFYTSGIEKFIIPSKVRSLGKWGLGTRFLNTVIVLPSTEPKVASSFMDHPDNLVIYVQDIKKYESGDWAQYRDRLHPMLTATPDKFEYTGKGLPSVTFSSNIPGYEIDEKVINDLEENAGEHSISFPVTFKGEREFTVNYVYTYTVDKGNQEIVWEQDLSDLHVGDRIELQAYATSGLPVEYYIYNGAEIETADGKTYLVCKNIGTAILSASQYGDANWLEANRIEKEINIKEASAIKDITSENATPVSFYTLDGHETTGQQKGLLIVRYSDGSVHKVFIK